MGVSGLTLLMHVKEGRYTKDFGWSPDSKIAATPLIRSGTEIEANNADPSSFRNYRQSLPDHTEDVFEEMRRLLDKLVSVGVRTHIERRSIRRREITTGERLIP